MNGYAEFEDSDIRDSQIAMPSTPGGTLQNGYHTRQDLEEWVFQKGPVISQYSQKKLSILDRYKNDCVVFVFVFCLFLFVFHFISHLILKHIHPFQIIIIHDYIYIVSGFGGNSF